MTTDPGASILARLLNLAKQRGEDYNLVLNRLDWNGCCVAWRRPATPTGSC